MRLRSDELPSTPTSINSTPAVTAPSSPAAIESTTVSPKELINRRTGAVALAVFLRIGASMAAYGAAITFYGAPLTMSLMAGALVIASVVWIGDRVVSWIRTGKLMPASDRNGTTGAAARLTTASAASTLASGGTGIYLHELGHSIAAIACFKDANPKIVVDYFRGGATSFSVAGGVTRLGALIGARGSMRLITAAGIVASTVTAMTLFWCGDMLRESHPWMADFVTAHGITQIANEVFYGFSAFWVSKTQLSHDFVRLWVMGGIHPLVPITLMIALPLIQHSYYFSRDWKDERLPAVV